MKKYVLVLVLTTLAFACKDKTVDPVELTTLELLTGTTGSKTWKLSDGTAKKGNLEVNLISTQNPCVTDNLVKLYQDFTYEFLEGSTKCNPSTDPDLIVKSNWSLSSDQKQITVSKFIFLNRTVDNPVFQISELTETSFSGSTTVVLDGESYSMTVKFASVK